MLSAYVPLALALLATVLMAVVIFAPVPVPATVTMSFAPPMTPAYEPPRFEPPAYDAPLREERLVTSCDTEPRWPVLVDPAAFACDTATRLELVRALVSVRGAWADAILRQALEDEHDTAVREAILRANGSAAQVGRETAAPA